jgi:Fur family peroxide stress response transcriptional regulator
MKRAPAATTAQPEPPNADFRLTAQRREVLEVLMAKRDHPTAAEVFQRAKEHMPSISLATVYNCLETLTHAGYVRQVNLDRAPSRYCPNLADHAHFCCQACGQITDIDFKTKSPISKHLSLPEGNTLTKCDVVLHGLCSSCAAASSTPNFKSPLK